MFGNIVGKVALRSYPASFSEDVASTTGDDGRVLVLRAGRVAAEGREVRRVPGPVIPLQTFRVRLEASAA